jgi:hypothetical protein
MAVFTPPGFWDYIMDLDGDGVNDIEQGLALRKSQLGMAKSAAAPRRRSRRAFTAAQIASVAPKKRKVSAYQKRFGVELKRLIKAHPRTPRTRLMKRAHTATKKAMKK